MSARPTNPKICLGFIERECFLAMLASKFPDQLASHRVAAFRAQHITHAAARAYRPLTKLPEKLRRPSVSFAELARDALAYSKAHKRSYGDDAIRMERILAWFRVEPQIP